MSKLDSSPANPTPDIPETQRSHFSKAAALLQQGSGYATALAAICIVPPLATVLFIVIRAWFLRYYEGKPLFFLFPAFVWPPLIWLSGPAALCITLLWLGQFIRTGSLFAAKVAIGLLLLAIVALAIGAVLLLFKRPDLAVIGLPPAALALAWSAYVCLTLARLFRRTPT